LQKIKLIISYDGTAFFGSQYQNDKVTVVGTFNKALKNLNISEKIFMSGRTDKWVHSTGQVAHLNIPKYWNLKNFSYALQNGLPKTIKISGIKKVEQDFHSRFSAKKRVYRYIFSTASENPFENKFITFINGKNFDFLRVQEAIKVFQGVYNFQNFKKIGSDNNSDIREIFTTKAYKFQKYYILKFTANSFLRSQVRLMVGALFEVGYGNLTIQNLETFLINRNHKWKKIAPPNGLYLTKVIY
jgi:tRNA pseudouridine38-40 synthase